MCITEGFARSGIVIGIGGGMYGLAVYPHCSASEAVFCDAAGGGGGGTFCGSPVATPKAPQPLMEPIPATLDPSHEFWVYPNCAARSSSRFDAPFDPLSLSLHESAASPSDDLTSDTCEENYSIDKCASRTCSDPWGFIFRSRDLDLLLLSSLESRLIRGGEKRFLCKGRLFSCSMVRSINLWVVLIQPRTHIAV